MGYDTGEPNLAPVDPVKQQEPVVDDGISLLITRIFILFGGVIPFIPQYVQIHLTQDASGFSKYVCLVLVSTHTLRIAYWLGHWFDNFLLYQSILMTIVMLMMIQLCIQVERNQVEWNGNQVIESNFSDFEFEKYWQWTNISSYIQATLLMLLVASVYTITFQEIYFLIEPVGFVALMIEAMLGLPQIVKNYQMESTEGMNVWMVNLWTIGDIVKGFFYFHTNQPLPFEMCAVIQIILDMVLFRQIEIYKPW